MKDVQLYEQLLGMQSPWKVIRCRGVILCAGSFSEPIGKYFHFKMYK